MSTHFEIIGPERVKELEFPGRGIDRVGRFADMVEKVKQGLEILYTAPNHKELLTEINSIRQAASYRAVRVSATVLSNKTQAYIRQAPGKP